MYLYIYIYTYIHKEREGEIASCSYYIIVASYNFILHGKLGVRTSLSPILQYHTI